MADLRPLNSKAGDKVRACNKNSCGRYFSNLLNFCPHYKGPYYITKNVTKDIEMQR